MTSRLRFSLLLLPLAVVGCRVAHSETRPTSPSLEVEVSAPKLAYCRCHHGRGAGVDGTVAVRVHNPLAAAVRVRSVALRLEPLGGAPDPYFTTATGTFTAQRTKAPLVADVAPGSDSTDTFVVYIDASARTSPRGKYRAVLDYVDGDVTRSVESAAFDLAPENDGIAGR